MSYIYGRAKMLAQYEDQYPVNKTTIYLLIPLVLDMFS